MISRELSKSEKEELAIRKDRFDTFLEERMPVLTDFMTDLGFNEPHMVLINAELFISPLSDYLKNQEVEDEDRNWITTIVGYFIGEYFVQKYDGYWYLNEDPNSITFLKYVVGGFERLKSNVAVDSFGVAYDFTNEKIGRDLKECISMVEGDVINQ